MKNKTQLPVIPLGTRVGPYGKICAILLLQGERYYHLIDRHGGVSMMPQEALDPWLAVPVKNSKIK